MDDPLYEKAVLVVKAANPPSTANLQRTLLIGYNRASRLMDAMIDSGILERFEHEHGIGYRLGPNQESSAKILPPAAEGVVNDIGYRVEIRTWYKDGKYAGAAAPFELCDTERLATLLTGDRYGEWQGTRHFDGAEIIRNAVESEVNSRIMLISNAGSPETGEITPHPIKLDDWGEYRVVTLGIQCQPEG